MDIFLNDDHDIDIQSNNFQLIEETSKSIRQKLIIKLLTFKGEWFLDVNEGVPYYQSILGKNRSKETIDAIFKSKILSTEGIAEIEFFRSNITPAREYVLQFTARTDEGIPLDTVSLEGFQV